MDNPYLDLTDEFNQGSLRALLSSGQAVVVHRLAVASKDGDWILREDDASLQHVLQVLASHGARYRFGAPLDLQWLRGGWSSHFEFARGSLRLRTDFVTRPPRIDPRQLAGMWQTAERTKVAVVEVVPLAAIKLTNREKDYAVVGELARQMLSPSDQLQFSRSARDVLALAASHPELVAAAIARRPALQALAAGREALEEALDRERRGLMRVNEVRLQRYLDAAEAWSRQWRDVQREIEGLPLLAAHAHIRSRAAGVLPTQPLEERA